MPAKTPATATTARRLTKLEAEVKDLKERLGNLETEHTELLNSLRQAIAVQLQQQMAQNPQVHQMIMEQLKGMPLTG